MDIDVDKIFKEADDIFDKMSDEEIIKLFEFSYLLQKKLYKNKKNSKMLFLKPLRDQLVKILIDNNQIKEGEINVKKI